MTLMLLLCAIALSAIAAFYSILGLIAIFSGAAISIAVMGSILEVSKIVVTSWLYRNWKETPKVLKYYFVSAIMILMLLTSMGIFGYLSKAHLEHGVSSGDVAGKIALIDEQVKTQRDNIESSRKALAQMDSQVDAALSRTTDANGATTSTNLRRAQSKERARINDEIATAQKEVGRLSKEKAPIAAELRKVEVEVGPIKYIAALIYGDTLDGGVLEKAVRIIILMIVTVFDPLAVLMFIAVNQTQMRKKLEVVEKPIEVPMSRHHELQINDTASMNDDVSTDVDVDDTIIDDIEFRNDHDHHTSIVSTVIVKDSVNISHVHT